MFRDFIIFRDFIYRLEKKFGTPGIFTNFGISYASVVVVAYAVVAEGSICIVVERNRCDVGETKFGVGVDEPLMISPIADNSALMVSKPNMKMPDLHPINIPTMTPGRKSA